MKFGKEMEFRGQRRRNLRRVSNHSTSMLFTWASWNIVMYSSIYELSASFIRLFLVLCHAACDMRYFRESQSSYHNPLHSVLPHLEGQMYYCEANRSQHLINTSCSIKARPFRLSQFNNSTYSTTNTRIESNLFSPHVYQLLCRCANVILNETILT